MTENTRRMKITNFIYPQYVQGVDMEFKNFFTRDDNLFENKIFKVPKTEYNEHKTDKKEDKIEKLLIKMQNLFEYKNFQDDESDDISKLRYYRSSNKDNEYISLVLMSVKESDCLKNCYFCENPTTKINGFDLLIKIANELTKLHKAKIIHGCLRPENIYLDSQKKVYIANFGLRQIMDENIEYVNKSEDNPELLSYLNLKGTVYEPPEMRKIKRFTHTSEIEVYNDDIDECFFGPGINSSFYTSKMDVYAFGILFYEIMTRNRLKLEQLTIKNDSVYPGNRHFPDAIKTLITQCLSINPSNRPSFPAILSAMKKIADDNQYKLMQELSDENIQRQALELITKAFKNPKPDIVNLFTKAFQGDVESLLIALQIIDNFDAKDKDDYGLQIEQGTIKINIFKNIDLFFSDLTSKNDIKDDETGETGAYKNIIKLVYPKTITVPLISYEYSTLSKDTSDKDNKFYDTYFLESLRQTARETNDPNLLLYLAFNFKNPSSISRSSSMSRSMSRSMSNLAFPNSPSINFANADAADAAFYENIRKQLEDAARFGSSEALIYLGCLKLMNKIKNEGSTENTRNTIENSPAYCFKVASDMYNPYGMINLGIMLQLLTQDENGDENSEENKFTKEEKEQADALAGSFYKLASQSRLKVRKVGLDLYNKEIEDGLIDDEASRKYDIPKNRWVDWFLTMPAGRLFVHASEECISKSNKCSSNFQSSHQTVEKTVEEMAKRGKTETDVRNIDLEVAKEYGSDIYPTYSESAEFIQDIYDKYQNTTDFPRCPRVLCYGQTCFPVGPLFDHNNKEEVQKLNEKMCVHFYCPRCNDYYLPSQVLYKNISGAYFPRSYLPKVLKKFYQDKERKPFVQYVPTIFGIPMMEVKEKDRKKPDDEADKRDGYDAAGYFLINSKDKKKEDNRKNKKKKNEFN